MSDDAPHGDSDAAVETDAERLARWEAAGYGSAGGSALDRLEALRAKVHGDSDSPRPGTPGWNARLAMSGRTVPVTGFGTGTGPGQAVLTCGGCLGMFLLGEAHSCPLVTGTATGGQHGR